MEIVGMGLMIIGVIGMIFFWTVAFDKAVPDLNYLGAWMLTYPFRFAGLAYHVLGRG